MAQKLLNSAASTLAAAITDAATSIVVADSATFLPGTDGSFRVKIDDELIIVTSISGNTLTVTRGAEETTAIGHDANATVQAVLSAASLSAAIAEGGGGGGPFYDEDIAADADIDGSKFANESITGAKLATGAAAENIGNGQIVEAMLADDAVTAAKLAAGAAVANIGAGGITTTQLAAGAVDLTTHVSGLLPLGNVDVSEGALVVGSGSNAGTLLTLAAGQIVIGDATGKAVAVTMSGDATIDETGAVTVAGGFSGDYDDLNGAPDSLADFINDITGGTVAGAIQFRSAEGEFAGDDLARTDGSGGLTAVQYNFNNPSAASPCIYANGSHETTVESINGLWLIPNKNDLALGTVFAGGAGLFTKQIGLQGASPKIVLNDFPPPSAGQVLTADASGILSYAYPVQITASRAAVSNGSGLITASATTATELGYLSGVTSAIQTQLTAKAAAAITISTTAPLSGGGNLSANRTLTIADAAADGTTKGAAAFNATNFSASSGIVNTIQNIDTTAAPRFARLGLGAAADAVNMFTLTQPAATSGSPSAAVITSGAHTALTASTEAIDENHNHARTVQFSTGALATQRAVVYQAPTYAFVGASTITNAATVAITGAPVKGTNATISNTHALLIQAGAVSTAAASFGLTVNTQTGGTANYCAAFLGGAVGIGTSAPTYTLDVFGGIRATGGITVTNNNTFNGPNGNYIFYPGTTGGGECNVLTTALTQAPILRIKTASGALSTAYPIYTQDSSNNLQIAFTPTGGAVFNESGNDADFRIEGDTQANLFVLDASADAIGIGTASPSSSSQMTIAAGTTTKGPLLLTSGTNLTTPVNGMFEYDGTNLYFTTGGTRRTVTLV